MQAACELKAKSGVEPYRYGFNGQEKTDEIAGIGNHTTAEFWEYDTRIGRRWNLDPKPTVGISQYSAFDNSPIWMNDALGDSAGKPDEGRPMFTFTLENAKNKLHQDWDHLKGFALDALVSGGSTLGGMVNSASLGTYDPNPAQTYYHVNTDINQSAYSLGRAVGLPSPSGGETPNLNYAPAGTILTMPVVTTIAHAVPSFIVYAGKATADIAKEGADLAGITQNSKRIPAPSGKANYRVPDELTPKVSVGDVKLVDRLHFSSQIRDILAYAESEKIPFTLYLRGGPKPTTLTPPLQKAVDEGKILLQRLIPKIILP